MADDLMRDPNTKQVVVSPGNLTSDRDESHEVTCAPDMIARSPSFERRDARMMSSMPMFSMAKITVGRAIRSRR